MTAPDSYQVAKLLATLPMQLARYFCTGSQDQDTWGHYALATSRYTHFTSPIRRYPDVLVHRLVAAALEAGFGGRANASGFNSDGNKSTVDEGGGESSIGANKGGKRKGGKKNKGSGEGNGIGGGGGRSPSNAAIAAAALRWGIPTTQQLHASAEHCNERKLAAKSVQDGSMHAYLCAFLKRRPACVSGIVRAVGRKFLCVFVPTYGMEVRVPLEGLRWLAVSQEEAKEKGAAPLSVTITFDANSTSAGRRRGWRRGRGRGGSRRRSRPQGANRHPGQTARRRWETCVESAGVSSTPPRRKRKRWRPSPLPPPRTRRRRSVAVVAPVAAPQMTRSAAAPPRACSPPRCAPLTACACCSGPGSRSAVGPR